MNIILLIVFFIIAKSFHFVFKNDSTNKKKTHHKSTIVENKTVSISSLEKPKELGKNKWLHPTDEFGKMEDGRV